ncbi:MAG: carbon starvation protein A [Spirochaetales bacterium]|nr:carbon starvation protein A [Spirochaetales bacterium]
MDAVLIMVLSFVGYIAAYQLYGRFIGKKIFNLSNENTTPAVEMQDGVDYVPTKKGIIFGHHFTSIAGTGPIVGPAIGVIWGWVPALIWVLVGNVVMGAVHDFGSLVISLRNQGKSISDVTARYINPRTRTIFFILVLLELWIVIAVFALIIGIIFNFYPQSVFPVWCEIPISIILGYALYKKGAKLGLSTAIAVTVMYITVVLGHFIPLKMPAIGGIPATGVWASILLIYAFIASTLPVTTLLQPRDFINSWQLLIAMALLIIGIFASAFGGALHVVAPAVRMTPEGAPPMWPMLFITIACGAISGFHSLVSSGTSAKQVHYEEDALFVGYGSMITEGFLAVLAIIAVAAGIGIAYQLPDGQVLTGTAAWTHHYTSWAAAAGLASKIGSFVEGAANMISFVGIPKKIGIVIMGVFVASFAGTTLDTATRIQRYVIQELGTTVKAKFLEEKYTATAVAVITAGLLTFATGPDGKGALALWPLFGATNQALAALALLTITMYLKQRGGAKFVVGLIPAVFMIVMTMWGLLENEASFISQGKPLLYIVNAIVILITVWMTLETIVKWFSKDKVTV